MPLDPSQDPAAAPLVSRPRGAPGAVLLAGVAGACVLGLGLGMWARPSDVERDLTPRRAAPTAAPAAQRRLEIRVHGGITPAAPGPAAAAFAPTPPAQPAPQVSPTPAPPAEPLAPTRAPEGLVRVHAVAPARLADAPGPRPAAVRPPAPAATVSPPKPTAKRARPEPPAHAEAEAARRKAARLAKAKARAEAEAQEAEAARARAAKHAKAKADARRAQRARAVLAEARKPVHAAATTRAKPAAAHGEGPRRVASASERCASSDPGAALVCADPALGAADRQLTRAYRDAQTAGVPPAQLQRQQQRWLAARANAAREAPWAVHDVYLARIAELQDQTRQAMRGD